MKRDETPCSLTACFENGFKIDIRLIICENDDTPYIGVILFDENGNELDYEISEGSVEGEYWFEYKGINYYADVVAVENTKGDSLPWK